MTWWREGSEVEVTLIGVTDYLFYKGFRVAWTEVDEDDCIMEQLWAQKEKLT